MTASRFYTLTDLAPMVEQELGNPPKGISIDCWPELTNLVGGWRMGELTLFTSGTGTGKTTMLANLAAHLNSAGIGCYVASVEIGAVAFVLAMLSVLSRMNLTLGEKYPDETVQKVKKHWLPLLRSAPLFFGRHDNRVSPAELCSEIREAYKNYGVRFAILDNLQFFSAVNDAQSERFEQDKVIREFVSIVKDIPIHVFLIVHTRKTDHDNQRIVSLSDLKGSKTLADEAWNVLAMNKLPTEDIEKDPKLNWEREILALKLRKRGANMGKKIRLRFQDGVYIDPMFRPFV